MRISDWSSDVCSSDLVALAPRCFGVEDIGRIADEHIDALVADRGQRRRGRRLAEDRFLVELPVAGVEDATIGGVDDYGAHFEDRSEEHTSELQSLMRISYAVFCL